MIKIGYAGGLGGYIPDRDGNRASSLKRFVSSWVWTYQVDNIDHRTRSGYFLLKGLRLLKDRIPDLSQRLCVHLWGKIDPANQEQRRALDLGDVVAISGYMSRAESAAELETCDILFLPLEVSKAGQPPLFIPSKLYEYLRIGKPILALVDPASDCAEILRRSNLGVITSPFDTAEVARSIEMLLENEDRLGACYEPDWDYLNQYRYDAITGRMAALFDEVAARSGRKSSKV